jgi:hypothetical protein
MLLHIDGSKHKWFGDERWHDLIVILDDATSENLLCAAGRRRIHTDGDGRPSRRDSKKGVILRAI